MDNKQLSKEIQHVCYFETSLLKSMRPGNIVLGFWSIGVYQCNLDFIIDDDYTVNDKAREINRLTE